MPKGKYKKSEVQRKKISETLKKKINNGEIKIPWKGKKKTREQRERLREIFKGRKAWNKGMKLGKNPKHSKFMKEFLSNPSNHWNYIDGRSKLVSPKRYGDDWDKIRSLVYMRDNWTCQQCGKSKIKLDVHHIKPFLESFDNSLNNLVSLCRSCHIKEENKRRRIAQKGKKRGEIAYKEFK